MTQGEIIPTPQKTKCRRGKGGQPASGPVRQGHVRPLVSDPSNSGAAVAQAVDAFLESRLDKGCRQSTVATYESVLSYFRSGLPKGVQLFRQITPGHIKRYVKSDPSVRESTHRMRYVNLRAFFRWLESEGFVEKNPLEGR